MRKLKLKLTSSSSSRSPSRERKLVAAKQSALKCFFCSPKQRFRILALGLCVWVVFVFGNLLVETVALDKNVDFELLPPRLSNSSSSSAAELYLIYNHHSQFPDQLEALENAIVLSLLLNATLVLPFTQLGQTFPWRPFPILTPTSREFEYICQLERETGKSFYPLHYYSSCASFPTVLYDSADKNIFSNILRSLYPQFKMISSFEFVNRFDKKRPVHRNYFEVTRVKAGQVINFPKNFILQFNPIQILDMWESIERIFDIVSVKDFSKDAYQLYDSSHMSKEQIASLRLNTAYQQLVDINWLRHFENLRYGHVKALRNEFFELGLDVKSKSIFDWVLRLLFYGGTRPRLVHVGSLIGTDRIYDSDSPQIALLHKGVQQALTFSKNSPVSLLAQPAVSILGGEKKFVSIRVESSADSSIKTILDSASMYIEGLKGTGLLGSEFLPLKSCPIGKSIDSNVLPPSTLASSSSSVSSPPLSFAIFVSASTNGLESNQHFLNFSTLYPCIYTNAHFKEDISESSWAGAAAVASSAAAGGNRNMVDHYLPLFDLIVSANSLVTVGTNSSTFTSLSQRL